MTAQSPAPAGPTPLVQRLQGVALFVSAILATALIEGLF